MIKKIFITCPSTERWVRMLLSGMPGIKKRLKTRVKRSETVEKASFDPEAWAEYQKAVKKLVRDNSILLIHSSMDGLAAMGVNPQQVLDFLLSFLSCGCTIVLPAYAVSSMKVVDGRLKTYDPMRSPCWTGMLPNLFLKKGGVIRTVFPYNSLAAIGPEAENMMADNNLQDYVYGAHSAWKYCMDHHASILFIGTTSNDANTIQSHMIADVMGDDWPVKDWYQTVVCPVKINDKVTEKHFFLQKDRWTAYITDYHITDKLIRSGVLHVQTISECPLEYVADSKIMVDELVELARNGILSYRVPNKDRKEK